MALNKERTFATSATVSSQLKPSYGLWIDGKEVDAAANEKVALYNPATGDQISEVAQGRSADVNRAIDSAADAFRDGRWSGLEGRERARTLNRVASLLRERIPDMAAMETAMTGRCIREYLAQLGRVPDWFEYHAALAQTAEGNLPPFSDPDHLACESRSCNA